MGALAIAFDTIIVGALALPWVYLVIHLFFFEGENRLQDVLDWVADNNLQAVAGVLLFAMTYTLGSAIERIAQDFFNDDDLNIPYVFRMTVTENRIIARVYCEFEQSPVLPSSATTQRLEKWSSACQSVLTGFGKHKSFYSLSEEENEEDNLIQITRDIFGLQENDLPLKGEDKTLRLRQLHDQIMVLRGATFDGLVAFALCLFAWGLKAQRQRSHIFAVDDGVRPCRIPAPGRSGITPSSFCRTRFL